MNLKTILTFFLLTAAVLWTGQWIANSNSHYSLAVICGGVFILLSFFRPDIGLLVAIISALLLPGLPLGAAGETSAYYLGRKLVLRYEDIIILMLFAGWWAQSTVRKIFGIESKVPRLPFSAAIFVFIGVAALATVIGIAQETTTLTRGGLFFFKRLEYFLVFFMTYRILSDEKDVLLFLKVFLMVSFVVMMIGLGQIAATHGRGLVYSTFTEVGANPLASFYLLLIPFSLSFFLKAPTGKMRLGMGLYLIAALINFIFTRSRGGYIAFIFMAVAFFVTLKKYQWIFPSLLLVAFLYFLLPQNVQKEFESLKAAVPTRHLDAEQVRHYLSILTPENFARLVRQSGVDPSWGQRLNALIITLPLVVRHPLFGAGLGSVDLAYVDNQYVLDLVSLGLIGLGAFLFLLYKLYRFIDAMCYLTRDMNVWISSAALGIYSGFIGLLVHGLTVTNFYTIRTMVPFWFLMGILAAVYRLLKTEEEKKEPANPV